MTPGQAPARPAGADALLAVFRRVTEARHADWQGHVRACARCQFGGRCRIASWLADEADAAGLRLQWAEQKEAHDTTTQAGTADDRRGAGHPASRPPRPDSQTTTDIEKAPVRV